MSFCPASAKAFGEQLTATTAVQRGSFCYGIAEGLISLMEISVTILGVLFHMIDSIIEVHPQHELDR